MINHTNFGAVGSNAAVAFAAGAPRSLQRGNGVAVMIAPPSAPAAHAAWAVAAIAPQRKRRTATATDASVDRSFV